MLIRSQQEVFYARPRWLSYADMVSVGSILNQRWNVQGGMSEGQGGIFNPQLRISKPMLCGLLRLAVCFRPEWFGLG